MAKAGDDSEDILQDIDDGNMELVSQMLQRDNSLLNELYEVEFGEDGNTVTETFSILSYTILYGNPDMINLLLEAGADPCLEHQIGNTTYNAITYLASIQDAKNLGQALFDAVEKGQDKIVQLLLNAGADPNSRSNEKSVMHMIECKINDLQSKINVKEQGYYIDDGYFDSSGSNWVKNEVHVRGTVDHENRKEQQKFIDMKSILSEAQKKYNKVHDALGDPNAQIGNNCMKKCKKAYQEMLKTTTESDHDPKDTFVKDAAGFIMKKAEKLKLEPAKERIEAIIHSTFFDTKGKLIGAINDTETIKSRMEELRKVVTLEFMKPSSKKQVQEVGAVQEPEAAAEAGVLAGGAGEGAPLINKRDRRPSISASRGSHSSHS